MQDVELVLEAPFAGFSQYEVSLCLKLLYSQTWLKDASATLGALHDSLPALLRLAHRLDIPHLLAALCDYMPGGQLCTQHSAHVCAMQAFTLPRRCPTDAPRTTLTLPLW